MKSPAYQDNIAGRTRDWSLLVLQLIGDRSLFKIHWLMDIKAVTKLAFFVLSAK